MRKSYFVLAVAILSLTFIGCPPKNESGAAGGGAAGSGEILIGEYGSMTGSEATFGESTHNGIMIAIDEINAAGGVAGRKLRVMTEDTQSKAEEAANAVTKLISQNNVVAILGEVASSNSIAAAPICQANNVPMISPSSTNPEVTKKGDYIFRVCFIDPYQGEAMANYLVQDLKMKRAALLVDVKSDYSTGLASFFERTFTAQGGTIVSRASYAKGDSDFRAQLTKIKAANPEVVFVPGYYNDIGQIASQARDLGMKVPLSGGDGWESPKLIEIGGKNLEGSFYSNHYYADDPTPAIRDFVRKYQERYGQKPDSLAALGYDAAKVLADAMKRAGKIEGPAIRDAIAATRNFPGVTGTINIGPERNADGKRLVIVEIKDQQLALKAIVDPAARATAAAPGTSTTATSGTGGTTTAAPPTGTTSTTATSGTSGTTTAAPPTGTTTSR